MKKEEFERIKAAEKEHLRKLKALKQAVHTLERRQQVNRALHDMASGSTDALDTQADMVDRLARDTAMGEARLEIALEGAAEREAAAEQAQRRAAYEAELQAARARSLIEQMKQEMGAAPTHPDAVPASSPDKTIGKITPSAKEKTEDAKPPSGEDATNPTPPPARPEKTIGRM